MKFRIRTLLAVTVAASAIAGVASAQGEAAGPKFSFNAGVANDYVFRGVSQTNKGVQGFGGIDVTYSQVYAGVWTSNVDFSPFGDTKTSQEVDIYGGWRPTIGSLSLDIGALYYAYINTPSAPFPDVPYVEVYGKASHAFGPVTVGAAAYYSPEFTGETGTAWYYEGNAAYTVDKVTFSGAVGRQTIEKAANYTTWNLGGTYAVTPNVGIDLRYYDTSEHSFGKVYGAKGVATLKFTF